MKVEQLRLGARSSFRRETAVDLVPQYPTLGGVDSRGHCGRPRRSAHTRHRSSRPDRVKQLESAALPAIELTTLTDGGQRAADIARLLSGFLAQAQQSLDLAAYDVRFETDAGGLVLASLLSAVQRGVAVPCSTTSLTRADPGPASAGDQAGGDRVASDRHARSGGSRSHAPQVAVRDGGAVWTGSTNWTDDSWTRQENIIVTVRSPRIAYAYSATFDQLWQTGQVEKTGSDPRPRR